jgi:hypothetical protein
MPVLGDVLRAYIKPSLDGAIILRKRTSTQTSMRVKASKDRVAASKPSKSAHDACVSAGKARKVRVYKPGTGYEEKDVCPIKEMKPRLRESMKRAHGK